MERNNVEAILRVKLGSPREHTIGQIMATIKQHGGCMVEYEEYDGETLTFTIGDSVERNADTLIMVNWQTY